MKENVTLFFGIGCLLACLLIGVGIGYYGRGPVVEERVVEKVVDGVPVKIVSVDGVEDLRLKDRNAVNAVITFDREVPNGYGLLVVDLQGGYAKLKLTDNHGPGFKWGGPVTKLHSQWTPRHGTEPGELVGRTARFYSSDFPPEVLRNNIK